MVSASLALLAASLPSADVHPLGCSGCVFLPEYDAVAGAMAQAATPWREGLDARLVALNPNETRLSNVRQLTFGGQNAEAYWNPAGTKLVYQARYPAYPDEQIFLMNADGSGKRLVSTGKGRTTCSYFTPDGEWIYFSSTHERDPGAQKPLDMSKGYVWMVNPKFSLWRSKPDGTGLEKVLDRNEYIAETTIDPNGRYMTFTGAFERDLEIYRSDLDGRNLRKLTDVPGYDGGPFVSWDGKKIVYRRAGLAGPADLADYRALLSEHLVRPGKLEIWIMDADGRNKRQVTRLGAASFAPFLHPNGRQIVFSSNAGDPKGREFDLWVVNVDGTGLERVTHTPDFDGFPMFSRDGRKLVWSSNRFGLVRGETNVFTAHWRGDGGSRSKAATAGVSSSR